MQIMKERAYAIKPPS